MTSSGIFSNFSSLSSFRFIQVYTYIYRRYLNLLFMSIERLSLSTGVRQIIVNFALENFETQSNLLRSYKIEIVWMKLHTKKMIET